MLLNTPEINQLESRFISLFERTLKKGLGVSGPRLKSSIKKQFTSKTFQIQIDKILDDILLYSVDYTDSKLSSIIGAAISPLKRKVNLFASAELLPLTEEAVRQSKELSGLIADSIVRTLKDEAIYQESPAALARRIVDLWGGEKYRAERFARTFSADVATSTALHRYQQNGIEEFQFYATIDERTSPQCRALQGTIFKTGSSEARQFSPPLHQNCRSSILPVTMTMKVDPALRYETRDFTKSIGQDFKPLKDGLDSDLVKKAFKDVDKFKDQYAINKFILQEDIEKRLMKFGVGIDVKAPKVLKTPKLKKETIIKAKYSGLNYVPVKTTKEAEQWLLKNTPLKNVSYEGMDIKVANEMNESLAYHMKLSPKIFDKLKYYGSSQTHNELIYNEEIKKFVNKFSSLGIDRDLALKTAKQKILKSDVRDRVFASAVDTSKNTYDLSGIGVNLKYGKDAKYFTKESKNAVSIKWHPVGCESPKATVDHEFGHVIDNVYKISDSEKITKIYDSLSAAKMKSGLSQYAATNKKEFVAEAWSEYLNNPSPRKISKDVGDYILSAIQKG